MNEPDHRHLVVTRPATQRNGPALRAHPSARGGDPSGRQAQAGLPCLRHDPDLWFADAPADLERAKNMCRPCPVRPACLGGALDRGEPCGVWGGEILLDGQIVPRKRTRGRPRKDSLISGGTCPTRRSA